MHKVLVKTAKISGLKIEKIGKNKVKNGLINELTYQLICSSEKQSEFGNFLVKCKWAKR